MQVGKPKNIFKEINRRTKEIKRAMRLTVPGDTIVFNGELSLNYDQVQRFKKRINFGGVKSLAIYRNGLNIVDLKFENKPCN